MRKRHWADLSTLQRIAVLLFLMVDLALLVTTLWDVRHRAHDEIRGSRRMWTAVVFADVVGPLTYLTIGRRSCAQVMSGCCRCSEESGEDIRA
jgi:hypothetical protein